MTVSRSRHSWLIVAAFAMVLSLFAAAAPGVSAQSVIGELEGAPVDIHPGTCDDFVTEPAFDGGAIVPSTLDERWEDETLQAGILVDEQMGASGVDLNNDGVLQEEEVVAPTGEDAEIGFAESPDEVAGVDTAQPHVVAVHASPDAYDTIRACGSMDDAQQDDQGRSIIPLQGVDDASIFGFSVMEQEGGNLTTYLFTQGAAPEQTPVAAEELAGEGHPVDIHPGTCADWTTEPVYDLGDLQETNVAAEGAQAPGDMSGEIPERAQDLGPVYKADAENEFDADELLTGGPFVVAVHESSNDYETLVACGEVLPIFFEDQVLVILKPVGESAQTGMVTIDQEEGTSHAYLWNCAPIGEAEHEEATPLPEPTPTEEPTEEATAVIEETEVVVETEVITETVVVPAPTATAEAEQEEEGETQEGATTVELGDESPGALTTQVGQSLTLNNPSDNERTFQVQDLGIDETVAGGEQVTVPVPDDAEPGTYTYQVLEGEETLYEDELTVE